MIGVSHPLLQSLASTNTKVKNQIGFRTSFNHLQSIFPPCSLYCSICTILRGTQTSNVQIQFHFLLINVFSAILLRRVIYMSKLSKILLKTYIGYKSVCKLVQLVVEATQLLLQQQQQQKESIPVSSYRKHNRTLSTHSKSTNILIITADNKDKQTHLLN